uniref:Uncharacterized protein n=1 Tax=Arundo donax TaxID=35708 RepID=A0A0A9D1E8_ARUDO
MKREAFLVIGRMLLNYLETYGLRTMLTYVMD